MPTFSLGTRIAPAEVCRMLHELFSAFDELSIVHDVYKIGAISSSVSCFHASFRRPALQNRSMEVNVV